MVSSKVGYVDSQPRSILDSITSLSRLPEPTFCVRRQADPQAVTFKLNRMPYDMIVMADLDYRQRPWL